LCRRGEHVRELLQSAACGRGGAAGCHCHEWWLPGCKWRYRGAATPRAAERSESRAEKTPCGAQQEGGHAAGGARAQPTTAVGKTRTG